MFSAALRELAALGHDCTWSDSDGRWETWASQHIFAYWNPAPHAGGAWWCRVRLVDASDEAYPDDDDDD
jgi:hypothetical protein